MPSQASVGTAHMQRTDSQADKTPMHIKNNKMFTKTHLGLRYASIGRFIKTKFRNVCQETGKTKEAEVTAQLELRNNSVTS